MLSNLKITGQQLTILKVSASVLVLIYIFNEK